MTFVICIAFTDLRTLNLRWNYKRPLLIGRLHTKKKASDKMCSIFSCMYYCVKRAENVHTKTANVICLFFVWTAPGALRNNACKQNKVSAIASLMCKSYKLLFVWSLSIILLRSLTKAMQYKVITMVRILYQCRACVHHLWVGFGCQIRYI